MDWVAPRQPSRVSSLERFPLVLSTGPWYLYGPEVPMAAAYSMDLRARVIKDADAGIPSKVLAERYHVSLAWVDALKQTVARDGLNRAAQADEVSRARVSRPGGTPPGVGRGAAGCHARGTARRAADPRRVGDDLAGAQTPGSHG